MRTKTIILLIMIMVIGSSGNALEWYEAEESTCNDYVAVISKVIAPLRGATNTVLNTVAYSLPGSSETDKMDIVERNIAGQLAQAALMPLTVFSNAGSGPGKDAMRVAPAMEGGAPNMGPQIGDTLIIGYSGEKVKINEDILREASFDENVGRGVWTGNHQDYAPVALGAPGSPAVPEEARQ